MKFLQIHLVQIGCLLFEGTMEQVKSLMYWDSGLKLDSCIGLSSNKKNGPIHGINESHTRSFFTSLLTIYEDSDISKELIKISPKVHYHHIMKAIKEISHCKILNDLINRANSYRLVSLFVQAIKYSKMISDSKTVDMSMKVLKDILLATRVSKECVMLLCKEMGQDEGVLRSQDFIEKVISSCLIWRRFELRLTEC